MKGNFFKYRKYFIVLILCTMVCCKYKPLIRTLPSGKHIKEIGFSEIYIMGKNERNFIYEYQTEIPLDNEEAIKNEAIEIFCSLKKILDFKNYDYIIIKSNIILSRFFIFYVKTGKVNSFKASEKLCD